jgi:hypothetical protein
MGSGTAKSRLDSWRKEGKELNQANDEVRHENHQLEIKGDLTRLHLVRQIKVRTRACGYLSTRSAGAYLGTSLVLLLLLFVRAVPRRDCTPLPLPVPASLSFWAGRTWKRRTGWRP